MEDFSCTFIVFVLTLVVLQITVYKFLDKKIAPPLYYLKRTKKIVILKNNHESKTETYRRVSCSN